MQIKYWGTLWYCERKGRYSHCDQEHKAHYNIIVIIITVFDVDRSHLNRTILLTFYFWWCTGQLYRDDVWTWWRCALFDFQTNRTTMRYARSAQNEFVGMCRNCSSRKQIPSYVKPSVDSQIKTCEPNETTADLVSTTPGPGNYSSPLSNKHIKKQPHREEILDNGIMEIRNVFGLCKGWLGRGSPGGEWRQQSDMQTSTEFTWFGHTDF